MFYCNGRTCFKSYHAVKKANAVGIKNTYAFDAGIFEWVKSQPKHSELLGKIGAGIALESNYDDQKKFAKYLNKAKTKNKTLFIYDEVGKQVRWLQYALEEMGIKEYYFMNKGAKAYYASISKWK